jgi:hypothetical protein
MLLGVLFLLGLAFVWKCLAEIYQWYVRARVGYLRVRWFYLHKLWNLKNYNQMDQNLFTNEVYDKKFENEPIVKAFLSVTTKDESGMVKWTSEKDKQVLPLLMLVQESLQLCSTQKDFSTWDFRHYVRGCGGWWAGLNVHVPTRAACVCPCVQPVVLMVVVNCLRDTMEEVSELVCMLGDSAHQAASRHRVCEKGLCACLQMVVREDHSCGCLDNVGRPCPHQELVHSRHTVHKVVHNVQQEHCGASTGSCRLVQR